MEKKDIAWLFACGILLVLLVVSVVLGVTGFYSSVSYLRSSSDLTVGETVVIPVKPNEASVASLTFDGAYLPGEKIPQVVQINGQVLGSDVRVRVKAQVFGAKSQFEFITNDHFTLSEDGYFYFDDVLMGGNKITFCTHLVTPQNNDFVSEEKYIIALVVETVDVEHEQIWDYFKQN